MRGDHEGDVPAEWKREFKATDAPKQTPEQKLRWEAHVRDLWTVGQGSRGCCSQTWRG